MKLRTSDQSILQVVGPETGRVYRRRKTNIDPIVNVFNVTNADDAAALLAGDYEEFASRAATQDLSDGVVYTPVVVADDANVATVVAALKTLGLFISAP